MDLSVPQSDRPIKWLLALSVALPILLLVGAALYDLRALRQDVARQVRLTTGMLAEHAGKVFDTNQQVLDRVAERVQDRSWDEIRSSAEIHDLLAGLRGSLPQLESVFIVDPDGFTAASSRGFPMERFDLRDRDYYIAARREAGIFISAPFAGRATGNVAFTVTKPMYRNGVFNGLVGVTMLPQYFQEIYRNSAEQPAVTSTALVRTDGVPLIREPVRGTMSARLNPNSQLMQQLANGATDGVMWTVSSEGRIGVASFRTVPGLPLAVVHAAREQTYLTTWYGHLAGMTAFAAIMGGLLFMLSRRALASIQQERTSHALRLAETERRERAEALLQQAQKMEALGRLTGGVAHDFNNLLSAVMMSLELAQKRLKDEGVRHLLVAARETAQRGAKLTAQMLAFARRQSFAVEPVDANQALAGMDDLVRRSIGTLVKVVYKLDPNACTVEVDRGQLEMAVLNLAINARDAMMGGGTLTIATGQQEVRRPEAGLDLPAGKYITIAISDTGSGMTPEVLKSAFEPFYTTKGVGKGTGLGLSMVYGFARQSGGTVTIDTALGRGTTVRLFLPRTEKAVRDETASEDPAVAGPSRRILLVDDDTTVRELTAEMLRSLGHTVTACDGGAAAVGTMVAGARFDAAVLDYAMPAMNGLELAQELRKRDPALPIVFVTGFADQSMLSTALDGTCVLLRKPFTEDDLARAVGELKPVRLSNVVPLRARSPN